MSTDADVYCPVWEHKHQAAAVEHRCCACRATIRPGEWYGRVDYLYEQQWEAWIRCARCELLWLAIDARREAAIADGRTDVGDITDPELDCGHSWSENYGESPPEELQRLAFMTPGEVQRLLLGQVPPLKKHAVKGRVL